MKKSSLLAVPLLAFALLAAFTTSSRAVVSDVSKAESASTMHKRTFVRFCGHHCHHHGHYWCSGWYDYWCPGHH